MNCTSSTTHLLRIYAFLAYCCIIQEVSAHVPLRLSIMWLAANQSVCFGPALLCCNHTRGWEIPTAVVFVVSLLWIHHMMSYSNTKTSYDFTSLLQEPLYTNFTTGFSSYFCSNTVEKAALQWRKCSKSFCCRCFVISIYCR